MRHLILWRVFPLVVVLSLLAVTLYLVKGHTPGAAPKAGPALPSQGSPPARSSERVPTQPVQINGAPPQIWLDSYSGKPEQVFTFAGSGFPPNERVELRLESRDAAPAMLASVPLGSTVANAGGNLLAGRATVPFLPPGDYPLLVVGAEGQRILTRNFTIVGFSPWAVLDNYAPYPHDRLGFTAHDFAPGETVLIYLDDTESQPLLQAKAGSDGGVDMKKAVEAPEQLGRYTLIFVGSRSGVSARVSFLVEAPPPKPAPPPTPEDTAALQASFLLVASGSAQAKRLAARESRALGDVSLQDPMLLVLLVLGGWVALCLLLILPLAVSPLLQRWLARKGARESHASFIRQPASVQANAESWLPAKTAISPAPAPAVLLPDLLPDRQPALQSAQPVLPAVPRALQGGSGLLGHAQPRPPLGMKVSSASDLGSTCAGRESEDGFLTVTGARSVAGAAQPFGLFVVADGISAHAAGAEASSVTIETIFQLFVPQLTSEQLAGDDMLALLAATIRYANTLLYRQSQYQRHRLGCTVTAALVAGREVALCHVGKNRAYLLPAQAPLRRVTVDHSLVEGLAVAGLIKREEVYTHPMRNRIYRCLGHRPQVDIDTFRLPVAPGDQLLLCSDGLWQVLRDPVIEAVLRQSTNICQANRTLVALVNEQGGPDNITAILTRLTDEPRPALRPGIERVNSNLRLRHPEETRGQLLSSL